MLEVCGKAQWREEAEASGYVSSQSGGSVMSDTLRYLYASSFSLRLLLIFLEIIVRSMRVLPEALFPPQGDKRMSPMKNNRDIGVMWHICHTCLMSILFLWVPKRC